jgi:RNA polymerase sigma factor (sigma-70 family)
MADRADLLQEVFAKAFAASARAAYDGEREYGPFIRQIARNTVTDWLRRRREMAFGLDLCMLIDQKGSSSEGVTTTFSHDVVAVANHYILELPPELKGVHHYRFVAAESQERAARALGITRQCLRTLERRLLKGLRRELRLAQLRANQLASDPMAGLA